MHIVYIHGATASSRSFAFIQSQLPSSRTLNIEYDREAKAFDNLDMMIDRSSKIKDDIYVIAHSLGGIYAVYLQEKVKDIIGVCSLSTPFDGSEIATWSSLLLPHYQLFQDITPNSEFISKIKRINITIPWTQFVTTEGGVPWLVGDNDGIVTRSSMTSRDDVDYILVDRNHYEILQSQRVVQFLTHTTHKGGQDG
jgi:pimeloyl-ACP methyl ester carboxylesterase